MYSAHESPALKWALTQSAHHLIELNMSHREAEGFLHDLTYPLAVKHSILQWRSFVVTVSLRDLYTLDLSASSPQQSLQNVKLNLIFTGQGAQWARMGI